VCGDVAEAHHAAIDDTSEVTRGAKGVAGGSAQLVGDYAT